MVILTLTDIATGEEQCVTTLGAFVKANRESGADCENDIDDVYALHLGATVRLDHFDVTRASGETEELANDLERLGVASMSFSRCEETGLLGVVDDETGDIIGSGESVSEALADAIKTARGWEARS